MNFGFFFTICMLFGAGFCGMMDPQMVDSFGDSRLQNSMAAMLKDLWSDSEWETRSPYGRLDRSR